MKMILALFLSLTCKLRHKLEKYLGPELDNAVRSPSLSSPFSFLLSSGFPFSQTLSSPDLHALWLPPL